MTSDHTSKQAPIQRLARQHKLNSVGENKKEEEEQEQENKEVISRLGGKEWNCLEDDKGGIGGECICLKYIA